MSKNTKKDDELGQKNNVLMLLREMVAIFGKVLLPQPNTTSVQYVYFYLLSLKGAFSTSFCDWMLKVTIDDFLFLT
jgi:hypothetical protein